jgi:hypothetical protein
MRLIGFVMRFGTDGWTVISHLMRTRSDVQCRYRFLQLKKVGLPAGQPRPNVMQLFQRKKGRPMKSHGVMELDPTYSSVKKILACMDRMTPKRTKSTEAKGEEALEWIQADTPEKSETEFE